MSNHTLRALQRCNSRSVPSLLRLYSASLPKRQKRLPASYYRGGTSRALIFHSSDLPLNRDAWAPIFLGSIGSPDPNGRQLDGLGGGISSLSKVCVVGPSNDARADVDYTFAAIGVRDSEVDYSSNCGNMTAAIGPFAVDSGLVDVQRSSGDAGEVMVRVLNTNTGKVIHSTFEVDGGEAVAEGRFAIDGVAGTSARVRLDFVSPAGSKTGLLLPTGKPTDMIDGVKTTCIDAGNPCVFIHAKDLQVEGTLTPDDIDAHPTLLGTLDNIRRKAAVAMGLCATEVEAPGSIPKVAIVSPPCTHVLLSGSMLHSRSVDVVVRALSVGQPHKAVPVTVAMAIAAAAEVEGSVVWEVARRERVNRDGLTVGHASGQIMVGSRWDEGGELQCITVFRTARRLMEGKVFWK